MKIACIAPSLVPSSTANSIQVMKACHALAQEDGPVRLWVPGQPTEWAELAARYGLQTPFEITWLPSRRRLHRYDLTWQAHRQARAWGAELVYTWMPQSALLALWSGKKAALEIHDRPTGRFGPGWFRLYQRASGVKWTLMISEALRRILADEFGLRFADEEVVIAPNGVELERYANLPSPSEARQQMNLPEGPTAVYSGHFYAGRGVDLLLGLAEAFPAVQFVLAGGKPDAVQSLQAEADRRGLRNLRLLGFVENTRLPLVQAAGDMLLMPYERSIAGSSGGNSVDVCSPMKMFEYMAAGRAIITSDLPVLHEVLNEHNAIFCPPEDLNAWKTALASLLADPERLRRLGDQARRDVQPFTWRARAAETLRGLRYN